MDVSLTVTALAAERGGRAVFSNLSFTLRSGEAISVVGPNGAGKSTLLRVLAGLLPAVEGEVRLDVIGSRDEDRTVGERAHYIGHADALKGGLTARENLEFAASTLGRAHLAPDEALLQFGLAHAEDLPASYLSAGQRRRVALARLLVANRALWLLDEPATALDETSRDALASVMRHHLDAGGLIVAATHAPLGIAVTSELRLGSPDPRTAP